MTMVGNRHWKLVSSPLVRTSPPRDWQLHVTPQLELSPHLGQEDFPPPPGEALARLKDRVGYGAQGTLTVIPEIGPSKEVIAWQEWL